MIRNLVVFLAISTFPHFDCKGTSAIPTTENPVIDINNVTTSQNGTIPLQKNSTIIAQKNETVVVKNDNPEINQKSKTSKIRQVSEDLPAPSATAVTDDMDAQQSFYPSALMMYPFPMMNTYYPRYFPYTYLGHQGYPFYG